MFARAKKLLGPMLVTLGSVLPQTPPPLMPMYQPVQLDAGATIAVGALTGISAAKALPEIISAVAAISPFFMCSLRSSIAPDEYRKDTKL
jgi:hypothetical protein